MFTIDESTFSKLVDSFHGIVDIKYTPRSSQPLSIDVERATGSDNF
jgi:hypothetical protein